MESICGDVFTKLWLSINVCATVSLPYPINPQMPIIMRLFPNVKLIVYTNIWRDVRTFNGVEAISLCLQLAV